MKNVVIVIMGLLLLVLAAAVGKAHEQLKRLAGGPQVEQLRGYLEIVDHYTQITKDPSRSGAAAVIYSKELFKNSPPETAIVFFNEVLPQISDAAVQRAIRVELVELYLRGNKPDRQKAMDQLRILMGATPATQPITSAEAR